MTYEEAYKILTEHTRNYVGLKDAEALEVAIKALMSERELRSVKEERDAAVADLGSVAATLCPCDVCALLSKCNEDDMDRCEKSSMFVWRGKTGVYDGQVCT